MSWSEHYSSCIECGTTSIRYFGNGKCRVCYMREYRNKKRSKVREYARNWARANGAEQRNKQHFGGNRDTVLERDGHRCTRCGATADLVIHHRDRSGRGAEVHNQQMENLSTLCRRCHLDDHRPELIAARHKTHCKRGHRLAPPVAIWNGHQWVCRVCARERQRKYRSKGAQGA